MRRLPSHITLTLVALLAPASASADEPWLVGMTGDFVVPVTESQLAQFLPGGALSVALRRPVDPTFAFGVRLEGGMLFDGPAPADPNRVDPGLGTWLGAELTLRIRPQLTGPGPDRAAGLSFELAAGGAWTGNLLRPAFGATVGYGIDVGDVVLEPHVSVLHVAHFDDPIDSGQGVMIAAGLSIVLGEVHASPIVELVEEEAPRDSDGDGILDRDDLCILDPEDVDGLEDLDGCPEDDVDHDGILDGADACPTVAEDVDGLDDADGCPEDDVDHDGILDGEDACPTEAEVVNGVDDSDGCPDDGLIVFSGDRVVLDERVLFDTDRARVRHAARPILRAIVTLILAHPEWRTVRIEGHADDRGEADYNRDLSERRAARVREVLRELGVSEDRMESVGYGEERPREAGVHDINRRVEFVMVSDTIEVETTAFGGHP